MTNDLTQYASLLSEIKSRIGRAQARAALSANREMLALYWDIGRLITERQAREGWGTSVIPRLSKDLKNELPGLKGFSERNIDRMLQFYLEYPSLFVGQLQESKNQGGSRGEPISPPLVAKLQAIDKKRLVSNVSIPQTPFAKLEEGSVGDEGELNSASPTENLQDRPAISPTLLAKLSWSHNILLIQSVKDLCARHWYMTHIIDQGWSYSVLKQMIKNSAHLRQGKAVTNFEASLPPTQSDLALQTLKDPYIFDFLTLDTTFREKELEAGLIRHLQRFLLELGKGFSFVGRQVPLTVGEDEFHIDLLFYHLRLRCFVVIELKAGPFKPDHEGKMNFYLNVVDDQLKHDTDSPSIGLILCKDRKKLIAEYALRGIQKPIGISEYELTRALPEDLKSSLPTIEEIEQTLGPVGGKRR